MRIRLLRQAASVSAAALLLAGLMSCSTSSDDPGDLTGPPGPGPVGPGDLSLPQLASVSPDESCATAGNLITITGEDLVDGDFLASITINGVTAPVQERFDGGEDGEDVLIVATPALAVPSSGLLADVRVTTENGSDTLSGALRLFPTCSGAPVLVSVTPSSGTRAGFEVMELIGDNLACLTGVQFVSTGSSTVLPAEIISVTSDQSVLVRTPATVDPSSAPYQIVVTSQCGTNSAPRPTFVYTGGVAGEDPVPDATAVIDATTGLEQGPSVGGNMVRIIGRDLNLATTVRIGSTVLSLANGDFIITANGEIIIPAMPPSPLGASSTVALAVVVSGDDGDDPTPETYTYIGVGQPNCVSVSPNSGPITGGTQVRISGQNLNDVTRVLFGGVPATQVFYPRADGSEIVVVAPEFPVAVDVDVSLQISNGTTFSTIDTCAPSRFTFVDVNSDPPFSVTAIAPGQGPQTGGTTIVVTGTGLDDVQTVTICGVDATITSRLSEQVQATTGLFNGTVPATCDVVVATSTGLSATLDAGFVYRPVVPDAQALAGDSARSAPQAGGTFFRLQGINLIGVESVRFGGLQQGAEACNLDVQSNTQVSGTVPAFITPGAAFPATVSVVAASDAGVDSTPLTFTYFANPTVSDARGPLGDDRIQSNETVLLLGNNFRPLTDVFVGEIEISNSGITGTAGAGSVSEILGPGEFQVLDNGRIQFDFPSSLDVEDYYDVTIRTPGQGASCTDDYEDVITRTLFLGTRPTTSRLDPDFGPWNGGTDVTISGDFSIPVTRVTICGVDQLVRSQTSTEVVIETRGLANEAAAGAPCDVIVFNNAGASDPTGTFTFVRQPDVTGVSLTTPNCGVRSSPTVVPVTAGQVLTINGSDFGTSLAGVNRVLIGTAEASIIEATRTATTLEVFVPTEPAAGGRLDVELYVDFEDGSSFLAERPFAVEYQNLPSISSVAPSTAAAGTTVTITGTELRNADGTTLPSVTINGIPASVLTATDTTITFVVPSPLPGTLGTSLPLVVTTCQGQAVTTFTYPCPIPRILSFTPTQAAAGQQVQISGTDLIVGTQVPVVEFGGTDAIVDTAASTSTLLVVDVPAGTAGSRVDLTVTTCGGTATGPAQFTYTCAGPVLSSVSPGFGLAGTSVTLLGSFENAGNSPTVQFVGGGGPIPATITSFSSTQIVVSAPPGSGTVDVRVTTCGGTTTLAGGFTYCVAPSATSVTPPTGAPGAVVVVGGTNLQDPNGTPPTVNFTSGATSVQGTVVASSPTSIQVQVPSGLTGVVTVNVTTCGGTDAAGTFQYCTTPTITSFTPVVGAGGTQVTITGTDLRGADGAFATIRFGGVPATTVISSSSTQFIVLAPAGPTGQVVVDATTCGGTGQATALFSYCDVPVVTGLVPTNGAAGDEVTIFGTDLVGANGAVGTVRFGNTAATLVAFEADGTEITVAAPTGFTQGQSVNVRVTTCGGVSAVHGGTVFTYQTSTTCVAPTVTTIAPTAAAAGQQITVSGSNLIGNDGNAGTVLVGSNPATLVAATPTQLVVTVPAGTGTVGVSVTTCGGTAQSPTLFTYCQVPTITTLTPSSGSGGSTVLISGSNLLGANGASPTVSFGTSTASIVDQTATQLTVTAPSNIATGTIVNVRVANCGGTSNSLPFQFVSTTQFDVTGVTPGAGPNTGGQVISISGTGLNGVGASDIQGIQICDVNVASFTQVSDTLVQATTAAFGGAVPATCDLEVVLVDGRQDTLVSAYTYLPPVPDGQVFDDSGAFTVNAPQVGGTTFRILGQNLIGVTDVNFGGFTGDPKACSVQIASDTQLTGITPAYATPLGSTQSVEVFVESQAGVDPTTVEVAPSGSGILYRYHPNPELTGASQPTMPNPFNSRTVTVFGTNFLVGSDLLIAPVVEIKNLGVTDPANAPAGTVFDFTVPIFNVDSDSFMFNFPDFSLGDLYSVTITTPNQGAACVDQYEFTLAPAVFVAAESFCGNAGDDDQDGLIDCADIDCQGDALCP